MSDRRMYPTAYRRSAPPQHVRQRGFQPLPMLPVSPRTSRGVATYARWAGRLARLHPAVRALSTAYDLAGLLPSPPSTNDDYEVVDLKGATLLATCATRPSGGGPPGTSTAFTTNCAPHTCSANQALTDLWPPGPNPSSTTWRRVAYAPRTPAAAPVRYWIKYSFCQPPLGEVPIVVAPGEKFVPGRITLPGGGAYRPPQWEPQRVPPGVVTDNPLPVPYPEIPGRQPNPNRSPTEQTEFGSEPPTPQPVPAVPTPGVIVLPTPGNPSPEPSPSPQPDTPFPGPPATTRTRERKVILAVAGVPARIVSAATETKDVIDAFWSAMPEQFQRAHKFRYGRLTRPHEKAQLIWENLDQLDIGAAITNLAWEQLEDMAYGRLGKLQARAARKRRAMHGFTLGPAL